MGLVASGSIDTQDVSAGCNVLGPVTEQIVEQIFLIVNLLNLAFVTFLEAKGALPEAG